MIREHDSIHNSPYAGPRVQGYEYIGNSGRESELEAREGYARMLEYDMSELLALTGTVRGIRFHIYRKQGTGVRA